MSDSIFEWAAFFVPVMCCAVVFGVVLGWLSAHGTIATECRKLGGFYVGDSTFKCIEEKRDE